jgi:protein-S-isoprenylcysteine O-methyltransferase Ste14
VVRLLGISTGVAVHALFAVMVYYLYFFLAGTPSQPGNHAALGVDALLALQFVVIHSLLLWPKVRTKLERVIPPAFYGLFFCLVTTLTLLFAMRYWQVGSWSIWKLDGWPRMVMQALYIASWVGQFYALSLMGFGYQTGFIPWWYWMHGQAPPPRQFKPRGAYLWMRHPVYLSFLGLVWFTPYMTIDRAVLTAVWTVYIFVGSWLKDRRLAFYMGQSYRQYQAQVPGYPGIPIGPLARVPLGSG